MMDAISGRGYEEPTPVQQKVIPLGLAGHDLLGIAPTGTGKTAAYLIPVIMKLGYAQGESPRALILAPTRELAIQIGHEAGLLSGNFGLRMLTVYGGTGMKPQLDKLAGGMDMLVATPGRFLDIYRSGHLITKMISTLVLDEADRMMDMGFIGQIRSILEIIPAKKRQNLLFSATFPARVEELASEFLEFPVKVEIAPQSTPAPTVEQVAYRVPNIKTKIHLMEFLLRDRRDAGKVMIFTKTKKSADQVFKFIKRKIDDSARVIHANKDQNARLNAIRAFSEGVASTLVSTDITARGIDISEVNLVINFDIPVNPEDYVHRIGRTGRARHKGLAVTFLNPPDERRMIEVEKLTGQKVKILPLPAGIEIVPTESWEKDIQAREVDRIRRKADPDFKGAFHEKMTGNHRNKTRRK